MRWSRCDGRVAAAGAGALVTAVAVRTARAEDLPALARVLAVAFAHDPFTGFMFGPPGPRRQARIERSFLRPLTAQRVETTDDLAGAAVWIAPGRPPGRRGPLVLSLARDVGARRALTVLDALTEVARHHPTDPPHWYLSLLGVDPARRREGIGTALLGPVLAHCDANGLPAWLETTTEANVAFYERNGFAVRARFDAGGIAFWGMARRPRPAR